MTYFVDEIPTIVGLMHPLDDNLGSSILLYDALYDYIRYDGGGSGLIVEDRAILDGLIHSPGDIYNHTPATFFGDPAKKAYIYDGINDYIRRDHAVVPSGVYLDPENGDFSVDVWGSPANQVAIQGLIWKRTGSVTASAGWAFSVRADATSTMYYYIGDGINGTTGNVTLVGTLNIGGKNSFGFQLNRTLGLIQLYCNKVNVGTPAIPPGVGSIAAGTNCYFGAYSYTGSGYWNGGYSVARITKGIVRGQAGHNTFHDWCALNR